ncbi:hypothetical protein QR680_015858 [Steinernema hermaphroditum]|uniref:Neuropeptide-like protein 31 n=1 Tax=Steinernema hermaphroditum TaxID=289476 RepID=A0AA39HBC8_9BILA|nr:hypothetical protein QR680_015858 [Steinernema hermaphroditum]
MKVYFAILLAVLVLAAAVCAEENHFDDGDSSRIRAKRWGYGYGGWGGMGGMGWGRRWGGWGGYGYGMGGMGGWGGYGYGYGWGR